MERAELELKEYTAKLARVAQERLYLSEQQKSVNLDTPFAEEYRNDSQLLKQKQAELQALKSEMEKLDAHINATRTQSEIAKHELDSLSSDARDVEKENERLEKMADMKRDFALGTNSKAATMNKSESSSTTTTLLPRPSLSPLNVS